MKNKTFSVLFAGIIFNSYAALAGEVYTYVELVNRLTDLEFLSTLPAGDESCRQWSSFDRDSRYNEKKDAYIKWDANGDGWGKTNWLRKEKGRYVWGEMEGPGCIWRIWSATAQKGHVKIYLDGNPEPAVDLPFEEYFNCTQKPFTRPALVHTVASGKNCYIPIPFQKSCKIVADPDYGQYYHVTYSLFPKETKIPTFTMNLTAAEEQALDRANDFLSNCGPQSAKTYPQQKTETFELHLAAGQKETLVIEGQRAITSMMAKVQLPDNVEQQREILRQLAVQVFWDHEHSPSIWSPLGDFFGTGPGVNLFRSLPLGMTESGFYSNWYMPFESRARLEIINEGQQAQNLAVTVIHAPHSMPAGSYGKFHAKWHRDAFLPTESGRQIDWTVLKTTGRGRFCGVQLEVWNPRGGWWGEGDEKFFVDGEKFPSTFGTGSEDYFGYAWCDPTLFTNGYHNQTLNQDNNKGHVSVNRWHITDNIPFHTSFEGTLEKYYANDRPTQYACVAYWYQAADGYDPYPAVPLDERIDYYTVLSYPQEVAGILVLEEPVGSLEAQGMGSFTADKWRNDRQLWYIGQPGQKVKIGIDIEKKGKYKIFTRLTKAADYGVIQFYLDGQKVLEPIDLYYPDGVIATKRIELGKFNLAAGRHVLTVEITGANPDAVKRYMFGIDYIDVKRTLF